jgi:hypothetical protein
MQIGRVVMDMLRDGYIVHDDCNDYGEPGYTKDDENGWLIFGDLWCRKHDCNYTETYSDGKKQIHSVEFHYPRLFKQLEEQGVEFNWYDEWVVDYNNSKAYRTTGDSYQWQSSILWTDGDFLTPDDDITDWIEEVVNNPNRCLPEHIWSDAELEEQGFTEYKCGFENGWYPGMNDVPSDAYDAITEQYGEEGKQVDIIFKLSYVSQFSLGWCVLVREVQKEEV